MNVRDIKNKARNLRFKYRNAFKVYLFIAVVSYVISAFGEALNIMIPFASFLILLLMLPFGHGNIVTSLLVVNERGDEVKMENEGLVGFKRFKELFFTYFIRELLLVVIIVIIALVMFLIARIVVGINIFQTLGMILKDGLMYSTNVNAYVNDLEFMNVVMSLGWLFIIGMILVMVVTFYYSLTFALTPYLLERYGLTGAKAMSESARLMKGRKGTLLALYFSYIGWILLVVLFSTLITIILPIPFIITIITLILSVYFYLEELEIGCAVFFEEVELEDKNMI